MPAQQPSESARRENDIAVIGLAVNFPGARNHRAFWTNLREGRESIFLLDEGQLRAAGVSALDLKDPQYVRAAAYLEGMEDFDPEFFGFSPKEGAIMDPQHRHFLERCWEALEDSGHVPERFDGSIGVFGGCGVGAYFSNNILSNPELVRSVGLFLLRHTGNDKDFLCTRASYCFDLRGPSINIQTACSTSLVATHAACQSLLSRECDLALAGGSTIELPHRHGYHYVEGEILSPDGHCRAFDARSNGTVFGSGSGVVVLRRLADAERDGDHVYAVIRGSAVNNDGARKVGYLAPSVDGQAAAIAEALAIAGVSADEVSYVECHGTGTPVGDPIEVAALTQAFRQTTDRKGYCAIGSVKTNIGHLDTAAGVAALAKVVLSMERSEIPPSLHFEHPNSAIAFADSPFFVNDLLRQCRPGDSSVMCANSLGVGGTNAFLVVGHAPATAVSSRPRRARQLFALSARNRRSLDDAAERLAAHLRAEPGLELADVARTLAVGRRAFAVRRVFTAADNQEAIALLESNDPRRVSTHTAIPGRPAIAFLLPGGGAQYPRMGSGLYRDEAIFREHVDRGLAGLVGKLDVDLRKLWFADGSQLATAREWERPSLQLPAIFITEYALAQLWRSLGVHPKAMLGHSMGENTAACLAGVMSFEDCLKLVALRGQLFESLPRGGMLSVQMRREEIEPLLGSDLEIGVVNAPGLCVVSGPANALDAFALRLAERQVDSQRISISIAAHSRMLEPILGEFRAFMHTIQLRAPQIPFLSNLTGTWITPEQATSPDYWVEHLRNTVQFSRGAAKLLQDSEYVYLEVGPGRSLSSLLKQQPAFRSNQASIPSLRHPDEQVEDTDFFLNAYGQLWACGCELDPELLWHGEHRRRVSLPTYSFQRQRYWIEPGTSRVPGTERAPALVRQPSLEAWGFAAEWEHVETAPPTPAAKHTWLLFMDEAGVGEEVARRLRESRQEVVEVHSGDAYHQAAPNRYLLSPEHGREGYDSLIRDLVAAGKVPDRILHLWLVTPEERFRPGSNFFHHCLENGYYSLFFLAQALGGEGVKGPVHWTMVSNTMQKVGGEALLRPEKALALGPCKVIPREFKGFTCASVDVELPVLKTRRFASRHTLTRTVSEAAKQVLAESWQPPANAVVAYRDGVRMLQSYRLRALAAPDSQARLRLVERGAYLITGGLGGIGLTLAKHLARVARARLVLIGRTQLPARELWDEFLRMNGIEHPISRRLSQVLELEQSGAEVMVAAVDVTDLVAMREVVCEAETRFGSLTGVFHTAGAIRDELILAKTQSQIEEVFAAKVHGTQVLSTLFKDRELPLLVLFSSTSTATAPAGQVDYVAANAFLNAYADQQAGRPGREVLSINWGPWRDVGMAARAASLASTTEPATHRRQTRHPLLQARVHSGDAPPWFETSLAPSAHWILDEHRTREGHALVPGTTYLELARAALAELGGDWPFEIRDLFLLRPLQVADGDARRARMRLKPSREGYDFEVLSQRKLDDGRSGWELHAQARLLLAPQVTPPSLDLDEINSRCRVHRDEMVSTGSRSGQEVFLDFGPRWRVLRQQFIGTGEALAFLELPAQFASDLEDYRLHPSLMDIGTGFAMQLIEEYGRSDELWVPFNYGRVKVHGSLPGRLWSWVRNHGENRAAHDVASFDVCLTDIEGRVLVEVTKISFKRTPSGSGFAVARAPLASELELDPVTSKDATGRKVSDAVSRLHSNVEQGIRAEEGMDALDRLLREDGPPVRFVSPFDLTASIEQEGQDLAEAGAGGVRFGRSEVAGTYVEPRNEIERTLVGYWEELLGIDRVGVDDSFFDLGGHSLIAVRLFARIKKAYHVDLPISVLFEAPTIARCAELLKARLCGENGHVGRDEVPLPRYTHLVSMSSSRPTGKLPFFLVAGMFGNILNLRHLATLIGTDRQFFGLQARGLHGDQAPHETFEEMAHDYLLELRTVQPKGPYLLGGFSGGGITAYEMAHQLLAAGEEVGLLAFIDTPLPKATPLSAMDKTTIHLQRLISRGPAYIPSWARNRVRWELARLRRTHGTSLTEGLPNFRSKEIEAAFRRALDRYELKPYPRNVLLFRPKLDEAHPLSGNRMANSVRELVFGDNGWTPHVAALRIFEVPGNHDSMVLEPNLRVLAARLRECILRAETAGSASARSSIRSTRA